MDDKKRIEDLEEKLRLCQAQLQIQSKEAEMREKRLRLELDEALKDAEKISGECDRAVELAERLKCLIEKMQSGDVDDPHIHFISIDEELPQLIAKMKQRNKRYQKQSQKYRTAYRENHEQLIQIKESLSQMFIEQMEKTQIIPYCAGPIIKAAQALDASSFNSLTESLRICMNTYICEIAKCHQSKH